MKISSPVVLLLACFAASTVAVDVVSDRPGHATTTTLRGQRRLNSGRGEARGGQSSRTRDFSSCQYWKGF